MMLAMVSPVFEKMFYGDFKEGKSDEVDLPKDNCKIMKLLFSAIFEESCEMESLSDILPLIEVVERYQINKIPLQQMYSEAILSELSPSTYLTILTKYVSVMSDDSLKEAAGKIMLYTNNAWIANFDTTKGLPEEVLLFLLKRKDIQCNELEVFRYLVKWHKYQTSELDNSIQLTTQLFQCIRYPLIFPHILLTEVSACELVDKQLVTKALSMIYTSCNPLEKCDDCASDNPYFDSRKSCHSLENMNWTAAKYNTTTVYRKNYIEIQMNFGDRLNQTSMLNLVLKNNGIYSFHAISNTLSLSIFIYENSTSEVNSTSTKILMNADLPNESLVTLQVLGNDIFVKVIDDRYKKVKTNLYSTGSTPFTLHIHAKYSTSNTYTMTHVLRLSAVN